MAVSVFDLPSMGGYSSLGSYGSSSLLSGGGYSSLTPAISGLTSPASTPSFLERIGALDTVDASGRRTSGWGNMALGLASGIGNAYMGMKQYGLAKQQLETNQQQFAQNYAAQRSLTNSSLEDRQRARVASNPGAYQSVSDYMASYGIR